MRPAFPTSRAKVAYAIAICNAVLLVGVIWIVLFYREHAERHDRESFLNHQLRMIASTLQKPVAEKDTDSLLRLLDILKLDPDTHSIIVKDSDDQVLASMHRPLDDASETRLSAPRFTIQHGLYQADTEERVGTVEMVSYYPQTEHDLTEIILALGLVMTLAGVLTYLLIRTFRGAVTKPVITVVEEARRAIASKTLQVAPPFEGDSAEIAGLGESIQTMLSELREKDRLLTEELRLFDAKGEKSRQEFRHAQAENEAFKREILNKNEELLSLIAHSPASVTLLDDQLRYVVCSKKWVLEYGLDENYTGKKHTETAAHAPTSWSTSYLTVLAGTICSSTEDSYLTADGAKKFLRWTMQPWRPAQSIIGGLIITTEDITDLIQSRDNALQLAKLRSEFLANITHELRTPLNGIIGFSTILDETPCSPDQREYIQLIRSSGEVLLHVINDVLDFSKIEQRAVSLEQLLFSPRVLMQRITSLFSHSAESKGLTLGCAVDPEIPADIIGDEFRVQQILTNLVGNAIKFTGFGGINLTLNKVYSDAEVVRLKFAVTDTGIGIDPKQIEQIFKPFKQADGSVTRKYGGTGLGLSIASELVELMGGHLSVSSVVHEGSEFHFTIDFSPAAERKIEKNSRPSAKAKLHNSGISRKILVAEDNLINQKLICRILEKAGYTVTLVENGQESVDRFGLEKFDLIILDLQMPILGGIDAARKIRQMENSKERIPLVALTAHAFEDDRRKCEVAGFDHYLTKPIDRSIILETVANLIK